MNITFEHLLVKECSNNLAITCSGHDYVSAYFEDAVMKMSQQQEDVVVLVKNSCWPQMRFVINTATKINTGDLNVGQTLLGAQPQFWNISKKSVFRIS